MQVKFLSNMKKETHLKGQKTKAENLKLIMKLYGYEIWRDPLNYCTLKDNKYLYFSTFKRALCDIRDEQVRKKLAGADDLDIAIMRINTIDNEFIKALSSCLAELGDEYRQ